MSPFNTVSISSVVQLFPVTAAFAQAGQLTPDLSLAESHDSNLQPPILEDGAANSIQYHWGDGEALHIGHFSKWQALTSASRVTVFRLVSESLGSKLGPSLPPVPRRIHELPKDQQTDRNGLQAQNDKVGPVRANSSRRSGRRISAP